MATWVTALTAVAGIALLGGGAAQGPVAEGTTTPHRGWPPDLAAQPAAAARLPSTYMDARLLRDAIALEVPLAGTEVTARAVRVAGELLVRASRVGIALEARGNRVLEQVSVDVTDPHGGIRPVRKPVFDAAFDLPFPRPNGTMWIVVTAYDARGLPLGSIRRPFEVGPLIQPGAWGLPPLSAPTGAALPPRCLPVATTMASSC